MKKLKQFFRIFLIVILAAIVLVFAIQNLESVTLSFLTIHLTMPFAIAIAGIYALGAVSGSMLYNLIKKLLQKEEEKPAQNE